METRIYKNLDAFNRLGMREFWLERLEYSTAGPFQNLVVGASKGYVEHFGAEIIFVGVEYIACAGDFTDSSLHQGSVQDLPVAEEYPERHVYYFEEDVFYSDKRPARQYIVAREVEIHVHYAGENVDRVFGPGDQIEQGQVVRDLPQQARMTKEEAKRKRKRWWQWR